MKVAKQRKTCVVRTSLSLAFNESFDFTVEDDIIQNSYFVLEIKSNNIFSRGELKIYIFLNL